MPEKYEIYHAIALNKPLSELQRKLARFNIFQATGMAEREIKHTQFLSYLLDPNESHGLNDDFLYRFIQAANVNKVNPMPLADLNLSYARIHKEKNIRREGVNNRIDILIEIPSLMSPEKYHIVAIENKIRAAQGLNQLLDYRKAITESYRTDATADRAFFFLTVYGEQPLDECWTSITYSEIVLPAIEGILKDSRETISSYMSYVLEDYIAFIRNWEAQDPENDLDSLVRSIPDTLIETARGMARREPSTFNVESAIFIRYQKAIQYINKYRSDPRSRLLMYFNGDECGKLLSNYGFTREHSIRSYLRFSFLQENTADLLKEHCENPTKPWLPSHRHLAIELVIQNPEKGKLQCDVILTLGPTGAEHSEERPALIETLRTAAGYDREGSPTPHFSRLTPPEFNALCDTVSANDGINWIEKTIKTIGTIKNNDVNPINKINEALLKALRPDPAAAAPQGRDRRL